MMHPMLITPVEVLKIIAVAAREKRLALNLTQQSLSSRSGVSLGVLKKFERSGKISLDSILKLALILGSLGDFLSVFKPTPYESLPTIDAILKQKTRKRGRK